MHFSTPGERNAGLYRSQEVAPGPDRYNLYLFTQPSLMPLLTTP